jgi:serine/threonine protein kinase
MILHQILSALLVMHGTQLVHRDVKPDNILIRSVEYSIDEELKLFNITKLDLCLADFEFTCSVEEPTRILQ